MDKMTPLDPFKELACFDPTLGLEAFNAFMFGPILPVEMEPLIRSDEGERSGEAQ